MPHSGYTICTSEQRLTSTTVSHGFVMEWHSSPPFGSHGPCKHSKPRPLDTGTGVPCSSTGLFCFSIIFVCHNTIWRAEQHHTTSGGSTEWPLACLHWALAAFHDHTCQLARSIDSLVRVSRRAVCGTVAPSTTAIDFTGHHPEGRERHSSHQQSGEPATPLKPGPTEAGHQ